jgi:hypothetical protein
MESSASQKSGSRTSRSSMPMGQRSATERPRSQGPQPTLRGSWRASKSPAIARASTTYLSRTSCVSRSCAPRSGGLTRLSSRLPAASLPARTRSRSRPWLFSAMFWRPSSRPELPPRRAPSSSPTGSPGERRSSETRSAHSSRQRDAQVNVRQAAWARRQRRPVARSGTGHWHVPSGSRPDGGGRGRDGPGPGRGPDGARGSMRDRVWSRQQLETEEVREHLAAGD